MPRRGAYPGTTLELMIAFLSSTYNFNSQIQKLYTKMENQVERLVEKAWKKFEQTPKDKRLCEYLYTAHSCRLKMSRRDEQHPRVGSFKTYNQFC
jgi:hypothetical protein